MVLLALLVSIVSLDGFLDAWIIQPFGLRMCKRTCSHATGCGTFTPSDLTCHLEDPNCSSLSAPDEKELIRIEQNKEISCGVTGRLVLTRTRRYQCVDGPDSVSSVVNVGHRMSQVEPVSTVSAELASEDTTKTCSRVMEELASSNEQVQKRLLIATGDATEVHQFIFSSRKAEKYRQIDTCTITAVAYVSKLKNILVSCVETGVKAYELNGDGQTLVTRDSAASMAVDEEDELLFLAVNKWLKWRIHKMKTSGEKQTTFPPQMMRAYMIALDHHKKRVFVSHDLGIMSFTYKGGGGGKIYVEPAVRGLTVDLHGHLYLSRANSVYKLQEQLQYTAVKVAAYGFKPSILVHDKGYIYVASWYSNKFFILDVTSGDNVCNFPAGYNNTALAMCLIT